MIRLIPLLAAIAVLLWQPTEGWSDESDTLLEPDAVLTGTGGYKKTEGATQGAQRFSDAVCSFRIPLKIINFLDF